MDSYLVIPMDWSYYSYAGYWIAILDVFLLLTVITLIIYLIIICCKMLCLPSPRRVVPIVSEVTEVVVTPRTYSSYDSSYCISESVGCPYNNMYQGSYLTAPVSPKFIDLTDSSSANVSIFLKVDGKDKIEDKEKPGEVGEMTTSPTLKSLTSQINKDELKRSNVCQEGGKKVDEKKVMEVDKSNTNSELKDPQTIGYTTSGEPLSNVSSICSSTNK